MTRQAMIDFMVSISLKVSTRTEKQLRAFWVDKSDAEVTDNYLSYGC